MQTKLLKILICPKYKDELACETQKAEVDCEIVKGVLRCAECKAEYPNVAGIPRFVFLHI